MSTVVEEEHRDAFDEADPEFWDEAAELSVSSIYGLAKSLTVDVGLQNMQSQLDHAINLINKNVDGEELWIINWRILGATSFNAGIKAGVFSEDLNPIDIFTRVLVNKQHDYGPENIARFGRIGLLVRLHDKISRLINLLRRGVEPKNESLRDNYMDVINYCAIGMMLEREWFFLDLKEENK